MPYIGNDIVDLQEPANAGKSRESRYLAKILTTAERESLGLADNPDLLLWSIWAAKETAYKIISKYRPEVPFLPKSFAVDSFSVSPIKEATDAKVIVSGKEAVFVRLFSNVDYVHCIGSENAASLNHLQYGVESLPSQKKNCDNIDESLYLRQQAAQAVARHLQLDCEEITIKRPAKNEILQPPGVFIKNKRSDIDISLSHDGRFIAFAFLDPVWRK